MLEKRACTSVWRLRCHPVQIWMNTIIQDEIVWVWGLNKRQWLCRGTGTVQPRRSWRRTDQVGFNLFDGARKPIDMASEDAVGFVSKWTGFKWPIWVNTSKKMNFITYFAVLSTFKRIIEKFDRFLVCGGDDLDKRDWLWTISYQEQQLWKTSYAPNPRNRWDNY